MSDNLFLEESSLKDSIEPKKVIAVGPDVKDIQEGDTVLYKFHNIPYVVEDPVLKKTTLVPKSGSVFLVSPEMDKKEVAVTYFLVRASDVLAIYENN